MTRVPVCECGLDTSTAATVMEVYESETNEIVKRFLAHRLDFPDCISALDSPLAHLIPRLTVEQIARSSHCHVGEQRNCDEGNGAAGHGGKFKVRADVIPICGYHFRLPSEA
jgi:hypothetical protein